MNNLLRGFLYNISFYLLLFAVASCQWGKVESINEGYEYFPVAVGNSCTYDVEYVFFDDFNDTIDTSYYEYIRLMESIFYDNENRLSYRIENSRKNNDTSNWYVDKITYVTKTKAGVELVEDNLRYISLRFPAIENIVWNITSYNSFDQVEKNNYYLTDELDVAITDYEMPYTLDSISFDTTITVFYETSPIDEAVINYVMYKEVFAKNIGLVYKEFWNIESQNQIGLHILDPLRTKKGFMIKYSLTDYEVY